MNFTATQFSIEEEATRKFMEANAMPD